MKLVSSSVLATLVVAGVTDVGAFVTSPPSKGMHYNSVRRFSSKHDTPEHNEHRPATTQSRKQFISSMIAFTMLPTISQTAPANAAFGDSSNIALPSYIDFLIEKNTIADTSKVLYKGADSEVQIKRIAEAANRLNDIPVYAKDKKWSQVQGILTGPLGTLLQTMNSLTKETNSADVKKAGAKVKADIILISQEATKKSEGGVVKACEEAQKDLEAYAKLVF